MLRLLLLLMLILFSGPAVLSVAAADSIKLSGDIRYRHETIDQDGYDIRHRHRVRMRLKFSGTINTETKAIVQLSTGSEGPVNANQTLDNAFSSKAIWLDMAYVEYRPGRIDGLELMAGKFTVPFYRPGNSQIIWDNKLRTEGGSVVFNHALPHFNFNLTGAGLWVEERADADNTYLLGGQVSGQYEFSDDLSFKAGGSWFEYVNSDGVLPFFDTTRAYGNSLDGGGRYLCGFSLAEAFVAVDPTLAGIPMSVYFDYVRNTAADSLENAWLAGVAVGALDEVGSWSVYYNYREVAADAVPGVFTDSNFGLGETDVSGHEMAVSYQLAKNSVILARAYFNQLGVDRDNAPEYNKFHLDLKFKF